jgi:hypothetical protein
VDSAQPPIDDVEQQWITKYRNAIATATPIQKSRGAMISRSVVRILGTVVSSLQAISRLWIHSTSAKYTRALNFEVAPIKTFARQTAMSESRKWTNKVLPRKAG